MARRSSAGSDLHPDRPGASVGGRCVEGRVFDGRKLGSWLDKLRVRPGTALPRYTRELGSLALSRRTVKGFLTAAKVSGIRLHGRRLFRQVPLTMGAALVGQLLYLNLRRSAPVWLDSPLVELIIRDDRMVGVVVERDGREVPVSAARGVLLAAGGFARNEQMRQRYHPHPVAATWSMASPTDQGDAIRAGIAVGAATALMDDAWWGPSLLAPGDRAIFLLWERSLPGSIISTAAASG